MARIRLEKSWGLLQFILDMAPALYILREIQVCVADLTINNFDIFNLFMAVNITG